MITAPRYKAANNREIIRTRERAHSEPCAAIKDGTARSIKTTVPPTIAEARTYFHVTSITLEISSPIGLPAYQSAGNVITQ
jgi:hypothetical protein